MNIHLTNRGFYPHHALHENGGADEISVLGLSGLLADAQTPLTHAASHQNGGADEISVAGLSGLLADAQIPAAHTHDGRYYTETELDAGQLDNRYYTETEIGTWRNSVTQTEMGHLHGVTSDIQNQIDAAGGIAADVALIFGSI